MMKIIQCNRCEKTINDPITIIFITSKDDFQEIKVEGDFCNNKCAAKGWRNLFDTFQSRVFARDNLPESE